MLALALASVSWTGFAQQGGSVIGAEAVRLMNRGDYDKAVRELEKAPDNPFHQRLLIELAVRSGNYSEADQRAQQLLAQYRAGQHTSWQGVSAVAYAAWHLDRWQDANQLYIDATDAGADRSTYVGWGLLYLEVHDVEGTSESIFSDGLKAPEGSAAQRWTEADVYVGLAQSLEHQGKPTAGQALEEAAKREPDNLWLLSHRARSKIIAEEWTEAADLIQQGLKVNKNYLPLLELDAAWHLFQGHDSDYAKAVEKVEKINSSDAAFYEMLGDVAVTRRMLDDAIGYYRRSVELNPRQWSAMGSLGINLLRNGAETEGRRVLESAFENDSFNPWTYNTLTLLDKLDGFQTFETEHFLVRLDPAEAASLRPYVEELLERSLARISERYGHQVTQQIIFEMHSDHGDFAVRTLGLPGLGALGATFGTVVAMDSPSARPRGEFHWGSTLWHEIAHVVTLSLSDKKVPRWFTEGLSMMEERLGGPGWGDGLTIPFIQAWEDKRLLPLAELNSGFIRPTYQGQVEVSYFQAGWVCEVISRRYGMEKIQAMLRAYADGSSTDEVFERVLGATTAEVDEVFFAELEEVLEPLFAKLEQPEVADRSLDGLGAALYSNPDNYYLNVAYARALIAEDRPLEAIPHLRKAIEAFPARAGAGSPYEFLTDVLLEAGRTEEATEVLSEWWRRSPLLTDRAVQLAGLLRDSARNSEAIGVVEQAMFVDPLAQEPHQLLGDLYLAEKRPAEAVREFEILLASEPVDPARAHYSLARALHGTGKTDQARRQVLMALEIAPGFRDAQKLLLELVSPSEGRR